jgi:hypothetical protein
MAQPAENPILDRQIHALITNSQATHTHSNGKLVDQYSSSVPADSLQIDPFDGSDPLEIHHIHRTLKILYFHHWPFDQHAIHRYSRISDNVKNVSTFTLSPSSSCSRHGGIQLLVHTDQIHLPPRPVSRLLYERYRR